MTLTQIAFLMRRQARQSRQRVQRTLRRGLTLTLWRDGQDWVLSLTRRGCPASPAEVAVCRKRFAVPEDAAVETDVSHIYHVTRLRWVEPLGRQLTLIEPGQEQAGGQYYRD